MRKENFSHPLRMVGLNISLQQGLHGNLEQKIELSSPLASFDSSLFERQRSEFDQTKNSFRQKADKQRELISKKSKIENNLPEMKYTIQLASEKKRLAGLTRFRYQTWFRPHEHWVP